MKNRFPFLLFPGLLIWKICRIWGLLTQAGYLTIKAVRYGDTVFLDYPNLEVKCAMAQLYMERLLDGKVAGQVGAGPIVKVLAEESAESVFHILNRLFMAIDYPR